MKQFLQFIVISFLLVLFSAESALSVKFGNMLERFELVPDKQTPYLSFEGFFEPSLFSQIQIIPGDKKTETSVILPNTFINNIFFAEPEITSFAEEGILEKLSLEEAKEIMPKIGFGMEKKILAATEALEMGVSEALIANGQRENPISSAIEHNKCTVISK